MITRKARKLAALTGFVLAIASSSAFAQTTWSDAIGNWFTPGNWMAGGGTDTAPPDNSTHAEINNGGTAQVNAAGATALSLSLGQGATDSGFLTIGAGGTLNIVQFFTIGNDGTGNMAISGGGVVTSFYGGVGSQNGAMGTVTIDGVGSSWSITSDFVIGNIGTGIVTITNGGALTTNTQNDHVGLDGTGTLIVDGMGSTWTHNDDMEIGTNLNSSGTVTIRNGGSWTLTGTLQVGSRGSGTLNVLSGGTVSGTDAIIGKFSTAVGSVTVDGSGSTWTNSGNLIIGDAGMGTLNIMNGGAVSNVNADLGNQAGSMGTANVDGMGSMWTISGFFDIGVDGDGAMHITDGGSVSTTKEAAIGEFAGTGAVTVDGAGSMWTITDFLAVGESGTATMDITNGGTVSNIGANIGEFAMGTVTVDGMGSTWTNTGGLTVGEFSTGILHITDGGSVSNLFANLGSAADSTGTATVDGAGSMWTISGTFIVGDAGTGNFSVTNGATVSSGISLIGASATGNGTAIVEDFGSIWDPSSLYVGGDPMGPQGTGLLRLQNNGRVDAPVTVWSTGALEVGPNPIINGTLTFDGGTLRTIADMGFTSDVTLAAGGVILDSNGFDSQMTGAFTGAGGITKNGDGRVEFTNISNYSGNTDINDGEFIVISEITTPQTNVNPGGLLGGSGTLHSNVFNSGVVSPGLSPGTFTIDGNYTQNSDGTLRIEIGGLGMNEHDLLMMINGGAASLDGTLEVLRFNGFVPHRGDSFTILLATGGVTGEFSALTSNFPGVLQPEVVYNPTFVDIVFTLGSFDIGGLTPNQHSVADELDAVANDPRAMELIDFLAVEPLGSLPHDYDLIAPEELAAIYEIGFSQATIQGVNLQRRMDNIRGGSTGFSANGYQMRDSYGLIAARPDGSVEEKSAPRYMQPSADNRWGVFVTGTGQFVNVGDDDRNARGYDITTGGVTAGVDYRITPNFAVGLFGTYAHSDVDLTGSGHIDADGGKGGLFATFFTGEFYLDLAASGGWNNYDTRRMALLGDARGSTDGSEFTGLVAGGYDWNLGCVTFGPTASFQYTYVDFNSFTEDGSLAPLHFPDQDENAERTTVGMHAVCNWKTGRAIIRPELRAAWKHEYGDRSYPIDSQFASGAGNIFSVWGPDAGRDSVLVTGGIGVQWTNSISTYVFYDGDLGRSNYSSHNISGGISFGF